MPKRKPVEAAEQSAPSVAVKKTAVKAAEPKVSAKPRAPRATAHKHHAKTSVEVIETPVAPVIVHEDVARLAYSYWEARGFQGGSAENDWLRAEGELTKLAQNR